MIKPEQLHELKQKFGSIFEIDEKTGNLSYKDPKGKIPDFKLIFVQGGDFEMGDLD
ncbi:MAG: hypothetical protein HN704_02880 [Bacteroidetes bacterium]|jgi:hypothetical protein|nr:hypothetical protein [Bacteroidota bacterium]MBT6685471.1 hypothetical protein [Bacteroidota bacterium]MBT7144390.1 hypothetical protein [Bacteroidota bacterium]MBT7490532.1 hypothetical protein [Bacteroidota bacterium]